MIEFIDLQKCACGETPEVITHKGTAAYNGFKDIDIYCLNCKRHFRALTLTEAIMSWNKYQDMVKKNGGKES